MIPAPAQRIVLDTNVCLDLFVFHDPRWALLAAAIEAGELEAVTRADCRAEYLIVLKYPHLPLDDEKRAQAASRFDALIKVEAPNQKAIRLPVCSDKDDQKFLELARDAGAQVLITKDKALLKLARRAAREGLFRIMSPEAWTKSQLQAGGISSSE
ncbi:MAG: putative toxin-antitoxin system toxin component, PIN family [Telluria sp.]